MPRYVILHHEMPASAARASHWDLMLEHGETLRTWALATRPFEQQSIEAQSLADHRLAYLDYEGPVSGDRGSVTRVDRGTYATEHESERQWRVRLSDGRFVGQLTLTHAGDHSWLVSFAAEPTRG